MAAAKLAQERPGQTLNATALVHEAYLRLVDGEAQQKWNSRQHFFGAAAEAMRRILVEIARRKGRIRHGGEWERIEFQDNLFVSKTSDDRLLELDQALVRLEEREPAKAQLVKLRYFAGCSLEESAELLGISLATAKRYWAVARAWLFAEMNETEENPGSP
jgi:RNA polymerase sigma factor (TIGR02999 family)